MIWLYLTVLIFSLLSLYFVYGEFKRGRFPKKVFSFVAVLDGIIVLLSGIMIQQLLL